MSTSPASIRGSRKIHPAAILNSEEFHANVEEAALQLRNKPYRARSIDFTNSGVNSPGGRARSGSVSSFLSQNSNPPNASVETLINYLTNYVENILNDKDYLRRFEELSAEVISYAHDMELQRIVKAHGWTGSRYRSTDDTPFEAHSLLQQLSNLYLKNKFSNYTAHISNMFGLGDEKGADQILSFCPDLLLTCLRESSPLSPDYEGGTRSFPMRGACMLADISGFAIFSGAMCLKGVSGLDDLREATNGFLGQLVKTVYEFHGDVIAFAGDALICVFLDPPAVDGNTEAHSGCYRAIQCACLLRNIKTNKLSAHIGVSYGDMKVAFLGGLHDQWAYLLNGACVSELGGCIEDAGSQQVVVTKACHDQALQYVLAQNANGSFPVATTSSPTVRRSNSMVMTETIEEDKAFDLSPILIRPCPDSDRLLIERIDDRTASKGSRSTRKMSMMMRKQSSRMIDMESHQHSQGIIEAAALFVPRPVLAAVYSESLDHIGELRMVTTMFLSLDSYSPTEHQDPVTLQPFFVMAQQVLFEAGGFLRQFLVDDKGCVFIAMWGMPSFTYANNCSRALFCAASIRLNAQQLPMPHKCSIGITTGNVFCGNVGALERRDYAGIGNEVNLAARLMGKAKGRILIDRPTFNNLSPGAQAMLAEAEEMNLKGMDKPLTPYQLVGDAIPRVAAVDESQGHQTILRRQVKAVLSTQMDRISNADNVSNAGEKKVFYTMILGMPGTGKTTAVDYFRHGMRKRNIPCILIQARPGHEGVPYGIMRELFLELIGEENFEEEHQQRERINYLVEQAFADGEEEDKNKARLIVEMVLGVDWSDACRVASGPSGEDLESGKASPSSNGGATPPKAGKTAASPIPNSLRRSAMQNSANDGDGPILDEFGGVTLTRPEGDLTFYKVLAVLLKGERVAILIEDAHFCDELSWNELHLLLIGNELSAVVVITMRSSGNNTSPGNGNGNGNGNGDAPSESRGGRKSVLISQNEVNMVQMAHAAASSSSSQQPGGEMNMMDSTSRYGLKMQTSPAYLSILGHENSTVVEMNSLNEIEVKDILLHTLKVNDISMGLVKLVLDVSSGNAFWCKSIAAFIKERGAEAFEKAAEHDSRVNSLKQLILLRMEKLDVDHQLVLKHASIIGDEFSEKMLQKVLPDRLYPKLQETMELLAEHGFVLCIAESPQFIFGFQNDLIRQTVYELTPPRDSAKVHVQVAEFIELAYAKNLRPFYPILSAHYQKSQGKRALAFKFAVKAADQAISRGAFGDGLRFAQIASPLAVSKAELRVLLLVLSRALHDIGPTVSLAQTRAVSRRGSGTAPSKSAKQLPAGPNSRVSAYVQLKTNTENALEKISKGASVKPEEAVTGNKNRLVINKQPSARLNWQPSYVASKLNDDSDDDSDDDEISQRTRPKGAKSDGSAWCSIS